MPNSWQVVQVQKLDVALLSRIEELERIAFGPAGVDRWSLPLFMKHGRLYILQDENEIIGVAQLMRNWDDNNLAYLFGFSLEKAWQGQGLGTCFLLSIMEKLNDEHIKKVHLTVSLDNEPAINLYEKVGFKMKELLPQEYGPGEDRWLMELVMD